MAEHRLNWTPGSPGKGLIIGNDYEEPELHTWCTDDDFDGAPWHQDYLIKTFGFPNVGNTKPFQISRQGDIFYDDYGAGEQAAKIDPRLKLQGWNLSSEKPKKLCQVCYAPLTVKGECTNDPTHSVLETRDVREDGVKEASSNPDSTDFIDLSDIGRLNNEQADQERANEPSSSKASTDSHSGLLSVSKSKEDKAQTDEPSHSVPNKITSSDWLIGSNESKTGQQISAPQSNVADDSVSEVEQVEVDDNLFHDSVLEPNTTYDFKNSALVVVSDQDISPWSFDISSNKIIDQTGVIIDGMGTSVSSKNNAGGTSESATVSSDNVVSHEQYDITKEAMNTDWGQDWDEWMATKPNYASAGHQLGYDPALHNRGKGFILQDGSVWTWPTDAGLKPLHMAYAMKAKRLGIPVLPGSAFHINNGQLANFGEGRILDPDTIIGADPRLSFQPEDSWALAKTTALWPFTTPINLPTPEESAIGKRCRFHPERPAVIATGFAPMCQDCYDSYQRVDPSAIQFVEGPNHQSNKTIGAIKNSDNSWAIFGDRQNNGEPNEKEYYSAKESANNSSSDSSFHTGSISQSSYRWNVQESPLSADDSYISKGYNFTHYPWVADPHSQTIWLAKEPGVHHADLVRKHLGHEDIQDAKLALYDYPWGQVNNGMISAGDTQGIPEIMESLKDYLGPGFGIEEPESWDLDDRFSKVAAYDYAEYEEYPGNPTVLHLSTGGEADENYGWRTPVVWEPNANRVRIGQPGDYHMDLDHRYGPMPPLEEPWLEGWIAHPNEYQDPEFTENNRLEEAPNYGLRIRDRDGLCSPQDKEKIRQALIPFRPEAAQNADRKAIGWGFTSKTAKTKAQELGYYWPGPNDFGKWIIDAQGTPHIWRTAEDYDAEPYHSQYMQDALGVNFDTKEDPYKHIQAVGWIRPGRNVEAAQFGQFEQNASQAEEQIRKLIDGQDQWTIRSSLKPEIIHGQQTTDTPEAYGQDWSWRRPWIYDGRENKVYVGQPATHHHHLTQEFGIPSSGQSIAAGWWAQSKPNPKSWVDAGDAGVIIGSYPQWQELRDRLNAEFGVQHEQPNWNLNAKVTDESDTINNVVNANTTPKEELMSLLASLPKIAESDNNESVQDWQVVDSPLTKGNRWNLPYQPPPISPLSHAEQWDIPIDSSTLRLANVSNSREKGQSILGVNYNKKSDTLRLSHVLNYTLGSPGKAIVTPDRSVHTWNIDHLDEPHHTDYMESMGIDPWYENGTLNEQLMDQYYTYDIDHNGQVTGWNRDPHTQLVQSLVPQTYTQNPWDIQSSIYVSSDIRPSLEQGTHIGMGGKPLQKNHSIFDRNSKLSSTSSYGDDREPWTLGSPGKAITWTDHEGPHVDAWNVDETGKPHHTFMPHVTPYHKYWAITPEGLAIGVSGHMRDPGEEMELMNLGLNPAPYSNAWEYDPWHPDQWKLGASEPQVKVPPNYHPDDQSDFRIWPYEGKGFGKGVWDPQTKTLWEWGQLDSMAGIHHYDLHGLIGVIDDPNWNGQGGLPRDDIIHYNIKDGIIEPWRGNFHEINRQFPRRYRGYVDTNTYQKKDWDENPINEWSLESHFKKAALEEWKPGTYGKGVYLNGQIQHWQVNEEGYPHHIDVFGPYFSSKVPVFDINPDGTYNFWPLDPKIEEALKKIPGVTKPEYDPDNWSLTSRISISEDSLLSKGTWTYRTEHGLNEYENTEPWEEGYEGKGLKFRDGSRFTWKTNEYGEPHHYDACDHLGLHYEDPNIVGWEHYYPMDKVDGWKFAVINSDFSNAHWHLGPRDKREQILQEGLKPNVPVDDPYAYPDPAVYLWNMPKNPGFYGEDLYHVNTQGLPISPDEGEFDASYTPQHIEPWRLQLVEDPQQHKYDYENWNWNTNRKTTVSSVAKKYGSIFPTPPRNIYEPWEFGHEGKGFFDPQDGGVWAWKVSSPNPEDPATSPPGPWHNSLDLAHLVENHSKLQPFWISPDGNLSDYGNHAGVLENVAQYHPDLKVFKPESKWQWYNDFGEHWGKTAQETVVPQVSQQEPNYDDILGDRIPVLWYPNPQDPRYDNTAFSGGRPPAATEKLLIGQPGTTHSQLEHEFWNQLDLYHHPLAPEHGKIDLYEGRKKFNWFAWNPVASHDRVINMLRQHFPDLEDGTQEENAWKMGSIWDEQPENDSYLNPEYIKWVNRVIEQGYQGGEGKYIRLPDDRRVQWNVNDDGNPHHMEVRQALQLHYHPEMVEGYLPLEDYENWRLTASTVKVIDGSLPRWQDSVYRDINEENPNGGFDHVPWSFYYDHPNRTIYVGNGWTHHADLADKFNWSDTNFPKLQGLYHPSNGLEMFYSGNPADDPTQDERKELENALAEHIGEPTSQWNI